MTDEVYVRSVWKTVASGPDICGYGITLPTLPPTSFLGYKKKRDAWKCAAEFTRDRLEDIRCAEREMEEIELARSTLSDQQLSFKGEIISEVCTRSAATLGRVVHRYESILAHLRRGVKSGSTNL